MFRRTKCCECGAGGLLWMSGPEARSAGGALALMAAELVVMGMNLSDFEFWGCEQCGAFGSVSTVASIGGVG